MVSDGSPHVRHPSRHHSKKKNTTHPSNSRPPSKPSPAAGQRLTGRQDLGNKPGQDRGPDPTSPGRQSHRLISAAAATTSAHAYEARNYITATTTTTTTRTTASTAPGEPRLGQQGPRCLVTHTHRPKAIYLIPEGGGRERQGDRKAPRRPSIPMTRRASSHEGGTRGGPTRAERGIHRTYRII